MATAFAADQVRRANLPQDPNAYKVGTTPNFKPPEGLKFTVNESDPLWTQAKSWAHKHGLSQEAFAEAIDLVAGRDIGQQAAITAARNAELEKLGSTGQALITSINTWLDAQGVSGLKGRIWTAQDAQDFARLIGKFTSQGAAPFGQQGRDVRDTSKVTEEQWTRMNAAERLDYARSHDQSQFVNGRGAR